SASLPSAQPLARELRFTRVRIALHERLERVLGLVLPTLALVAQRQFVEGGRHLVRCGRVLLEPRVPRRGAVVLGLGEETLGNPEARVVGQIVRGELYHELPELPQRDGVAALRQVHGRLIVERIGGDGRRGAGARAPARGGGPAGREAGGEIVDFG